MEITGCKSSKSFLSRTLLSLFAALGLMLVGSAPLVAQDDDDDLVVEDCNQNGVPDVCELDPASNPELCEVQPADPNVPSTDACGDAPEVQLGYYYTGQVNATRDGSASCGAASNSADVWFKFRNPPVGEDGSADSISVKFSMSGTVNQYGMDPVLSLHSSCEAASSPFNCNDDNCGLDSVLETSVADGQTIYLRIARFGGSAPGAIGYRLNVLRPDQITCIAAIGSGTDCNNNGRLDQCDTTPYYGGNEIDCNGNYKPDACDIEEWNGQEIQGQIVDLDQNDDGLLDFCADCNSNEIPDACDVDSVDLETFFLWTLNGQEPYPVGCYEWCRVPGGDDDDDDDNGPFGDDEDDDDDERICGQLSDVNSNLTPDVCEGDCNGNTTPDSYDISQGTSVDCNTNTFPDECDLVSPLVGTGYYDPTGNQFGFPGSLELNVTQRVPDMFYLLFPNVSGAGRVLVGPIGTAEGSAKDIAVDYSNGLIYAVGLPATYIPLYPTEQVQDDDDDVAQFLYQVDRTTGAGTALPQPMLTSEYAPYFGHTYSSDGASGYVCGIVTSTIDKATGALSQQLPEAPFGIAMATSPGGDILSLEPTQIGRSSEFDDDDDDNFPVGCLAGVINRLDPVSGAVLESLSVIDDEAASSEDDDDDFCPYSDCRVLVDIAYGADGNFYGVTWPNYYEYDEDGTQGGKEQGAQGVSQGGSGAGYDLVRLVPVEINPIDLPAVGYRLETVGPLNLLPLGLGGNLPPFSSDCDSNAQPDECQPDCDSDGTPDSCELDSDSDGTPDDCEPTDIDCAGVAGGPAVVDRCGVCGGDGTSCLGCTSVDVTEELFALDGTALELRRVVRSATSRLLKVGAKYRRMVNKLRAQANRLYEDSWRLVWVGLPKVVTNCTNSEFCVTTSNAGSIATYNDNITELDALVHQATKKLGKVGVSKRVVRNYNKRSATYLAQGLATSATVPVNVSNCS